MQPGSAIGVDIGGTNIRAARVSRAGRILASLTTRTAVGEPRRVPDQIADLVRSLDSPDVACVGIGVPGRVDVLRGRVLSGGYVDLAGLPLSGSAARRQVFLDNDGNMAMRAEHAMGSARGAQTAVMFTIGTGIGGAVIADGRMLRGKASAGQLGHIAVGGDGLRCNCGRRGCVETMSSGTALRRHIAEANLPADTTAEALLADADGGDETARAVLAEWAGPMRVAIDTIAAVVDPDIVVLGGGLGAAMHRALAAFPAEAPWYRCDVVAASLGDRAGVIGAALWALDQTRDNARAAS